VVELRELARRRTQVGPLLILGLGGHGP
jgi:hypothetical protein